MKRTILIVDDQVINRSILNRLLKEEYNVLEAANGKEAMSILEERKEDISAILLDIIMPVMNGYEVLEAMQKDPLLSKIPVVVSSQQDSDEAEVQALELGAQDFVAKPYKGEIILRRLSNIIKLRETAALINKVEKDELTGLYNKQFFIENVSIQLQQNSSQQYDLICFGIECFKLINETYGFAKGDELLRYIAELLQNSTRSVLAARFNADMFYFLTKHRDEYRAELFSPWMRKVNEFPIDMDVKIHCGIYFIKDNTLPVSVMCDRAQLAAEKNKGMYNLPFFYSDDSIRQKLMEEQFITSNMRTALENEQFQVYYQPKYDLNNEMVAGAEALVRWIHPEKGMLSPGIFVPLFERNGFISQLDQYVWERACQDIREWMNKGYPEIAVSVNVSRADIYNPKLADILLGLLAKYEIPIRYLHLEITESAYTDNPNQIILVVNKLRDIGFIIEMDDFGSGYSSLNMLAEMPVDILKLDMHFVQSETNKTSGKGILSFVISLAKWLNLAVVAEGVETSGQIAILRSMDCNYVQGFYYAKPMTKDDFETLLKTSNITEMICTSRTVQEYVAEEEVIDASDRTMLIVDDIELNRAVLAGTFEGVYQIVEKENGHTAWEYLEEHYQDVEIILLDLLMPVMDGFQLLDKIRGDERMCELPVIITSQGDLDSEQRALEMKADDFISKPYNPDIIKHRVHNVVASHQLFQLKQGENGQSLSERAMHMVADLRPHFDIVRLVEPEHTLVCGEEALSECDIHACYAVWGKATRCNNCISLRALYDKARYSKLEYSENGLYFVISEYVPFADGGAVIEMVTKLEDEYVDNVFDKQMLYTNLDAIHQQLERDELTNVYNRRYIDSHLKALLDKAEKDDSHLGIAMVDIDMFKRLNDTYGHLVGDKVLKAVAKMLEDNVTIRKGDFVARFGGDEFLIVCQNIELSELKNHVEEVSHLVKHIQIENVENLNIGISAGCVSTDEFSDVEAVDLIDQADRRLYQAKQTGRGCVV